jgi:GntR family transcriptional regulator, histidine utilization repressor
MPGSKYQQIKRYILAQIESSAWPENHPVPSENQLASQFSVSRMTARRALQELSEQGVLLRTQGAATCVASLKSQSSMLEIRNIADEILSRKHDYYAQVIELTIIQASEDMAAHFAIKKGQDIYNSRICHFENRIPLQLENRYVNPALVPEYLQQDFSQITPHAYLCEVAPLTEAEHQIEATLPDIATQQSLKINATQPCLQIQRRTWSKDGIVSYAILTHPGNRYRLGGHLTFPSKQ